MKMRMSPEDEEKGIVRAAAMCLEYTQCMQRCDVYQGGASCAKKCEYAYKKEISTNIVYISLAHCVHTKRTLPYSRQTMNALGD